MHAGRAVELVVEVHLTDYGLDDPFLVVSVEDDESSTAPGAGRPRAAAGARRWNGRCRACMPSVACVAQHGFHAVRHLAGRLVGEGDRQDLPGADPLIGDQLGDALGQDPRLSRSRARPPPGWGRLPAVTAWRCCGLSLSSRSMVGCQRFRSSQTDAPQVPGSGDLRGGGTDGWAGNPAPGFRLSRSPTGRCIRQRVALILMADLQ